MKIRSHFYFVMRYENEYEIAEIVRGFEDSTISRDTWKHAEHLTVALHYLSLHDIDTATEKMRHLQAARRVRRRSDKGNAISRDPHRFLDADSC
jgi:hypothetical protein